MSDPAVVPPAVRAQLLGLEHSSLLSTRAMTWSEVMSRITAQLTFTSAVLVVLALDVRNGDPAGSFRPLALGLGFALLLTGTLTTLRVHYASLEDAQLMRGMNRLRAGYVALDPGLEPYLTTGFTDDADGVVRTYGLGYSRTAAQQVMASAIFFSSVVNALVAGGWVGILAAPAGRTVAVVVGVLAGLGYLAAFMYAVARLFAQAERMPELVHFPTAPPAPPSPS
jgi:hypothetical protein